MPVLSNINCLSSSGLQVSALQIKISQQDFVVVLGHLRHLIVLVYGREPKHFLAVFNHHNGGQLLGEARSVDVVGLGQFGHLAHVDTQELELVGAVLVGVAVPQLLGLL